ncbi:histidinol-phosphate transaminase [Caldimonas brevitalea]|uniref:Histidinol-phosphate aminotransferase n=1 Tax=Caldimonas brevitalea TaxID=413882 RepID=A0A0G3BVF4_9BURK|nr:histidinol-phosphate transaminase [Caldimonas brevitalea]AKJ31346.1 histidinol-phosphate aminotransferase [Caldimonas brevitalea]
MASLEQRMSAFLRPDLQAMLPYVVQPSAGYVKLDAMENPYTLPLALQRELGERLGAVALNRYPGDRVEDLRRALARHAGLPEGYALMLGNGSDELISLLALCCNRPGASVVAPSPGFVMYAVSAELHGLNYVGVPLTPDRFDLDEPAMLAAIETHRPALVYIAYPNNPTANLFDDTIIERVVQAAPGLVVIDEAYQPFSSKTYLDRLTRHEHVILMRTMSKFGLAGVRIGYMMGRSSLIEQIEKVRPPYNISVLNCEAALFALEHETEFARQAALLRAERERLIEALREMPGVLPFPSDANMVLVRMPDAERSFAHLKQRGVLVKKVSSIPALANCLRLTVGTAEENDLMIAALRESVA